MLLLIPLEPKAVSQFIAQANYSRNSSQIAPSLALHVVEKISLRGGDYQIMVEKSSF